MVAAVCTITTTDDDEGEWHEAHPQLRRKRREGRPRQRARHAANDVDALALEAERDRGQGFIHRQREVAVAANSGFVAERLLECVAEADASVFDRVVLADFEIAFRADGQVHRRVLGEEG